jgi:hypothetical protein
MFGIDLSKVYWLEFAKEFSCAVAFLVVGYLTILFLFSL